MATEAEGTNLKTEEEPKDVTPITTASVDGLDKHTTSVQVFDLSAPEGEVPECDPDSDSSRSCQENIKQDFPVLHEKVEVAIVDTVGDVPVDSRRAWLACVGALFINLFTGINNASGIFLLEFLRDEDLAITSTAHISWLFTTASGLTCVFGPISGMIIDRYGTTISAILGSLILSGGLMGSSFVESFNILFATYSVPVGCGFSLIVCSTTCVVRQLFQKHSSLATALQICGFGLGMLIVIPVSQFNSTNYGWRRAYQVWAGVVFISGFAGLLFNSKINTKIQTNLNSSKAVDKKQKKTSVKTTENTTSDGTSTKSLQHVLSQGETDSMLNDKGKLKRIESSITKHTLITNMPDLPFGMKKRLFPRCCLQCRHCKITLDMSVFRSRAYCLWLFAFACFCSVYYMPTLYLCSLAKERTLGLEHVTISVALFNSILAISSLAFSQLIDHPLLHGGEAKCRLLQLTLLVAGINGILLPAVDTSSYIAFLIYATIGGIAVGGATIMGPIMTFTLIGHKKMGIGYGYICLVSGISVTLGPALGGYLHDITNSYEPAFYLAAGMYFLQLVLMFGVSKLHTKELNSLPHVILSGDELHELEVGCELDNDHEKKCLFLSKEDVDTRNKEFWNAYIAMKAESIITTANTHSRYLREIEFQRSQLQMTKGKAVANIQWNTDMKSVTVSNTKVEPSHKLPENHRQQPNNTRNFSALGSVGSHSFGRASVYRVKSRLSETLPTITEIRRFPANGTTEASPKQPDAVIMKRATVAALTNTDATTNYHLNITKQHQLPSLAVHNLHSSVARETHLTQKELQPLQTSQTSAERFVSANRHGVVSVPLAVETNLPCYWSKSPSRSENVFVSKEVNEVLEIDLNNYLEDSNIEPKPSSSSIQQQPPSEFTTSPINAKNVMEVSQIVIPKPVHAVCDKGLNHHNVEYLPQQSSINHPPSDLGGAFKPVGILTSGPDKLEIGYANVVNNKTEESEDEDDLEVRGYNENIDIMR